MPTTTRLQCLLRPWTLLLMGHSDFFIVKLGSYKEKVNLYWNFAARHHSKSTGHHSKGTGHHGIWLWAWVLRLLQGLPFLSWLLSEKLIAPLPPSFLLPFALWVTSNLRPDFVGIRSISSAGQSDCDDKAHLEFTLKEMCIHSLSGPNFIKLWSRKYWIANIFLC